MPWDQRGQFQRGFEVSRGVNFVILCGFWYFRKPSCGENNLFVCPGFLRSWRAIFLICRSVTDLKSTASDSFFLGDGSFKNLFTVSTWCPNISGITSREVPMADSLITTSFVLSIKTFPCPIAAKYFKKLYSPFTYEADRMQMAANHDAQSNVNKCNIAAITCLAFLLWFSKILSTKSS